jgi:hypothetical protein
MRQGTRQFKPRDAARALVSLLTLAAIFAACYLVFPTIQCLIVPAAPAGKTGPWVIPPILAFHFGACAVATVALMPLVLTPLWRRWRAEDAAEGTKFDPFHNRPVTRVWLYVKGMVLAAIYLISLIFYLLSWTVVGPGGVEEHLPWGVKQHAFDKIVSLTMIPEGFRVDSLKKNGPWYQVRFEDGRRVTFGADNEGISKLELAATAHFIGLRAGRSWQVPSDARPRQ